MNSRGKLRFAESPNLVASASDSENTHSPQSRQLSRQTLLWGGLGGLVMLVASVWAWGACVESQWIEITHVTHKLRRLAPQWDGVRLLQLSDIHLDEWMSQDRLSTIVTLANKQAADIIVLTGDYVSYEPPGWEQVLGGALKHLSAPLGVYGVLGNHDQWGKSTAVRRALAVGGVTELCNEVLTLMRDGASLHLAGVDDVKWGKADIIRVIEQLPHEGAAVLLAHEPDFADVVAKLNRFDVQLSGHSHGGQIQLPLWGPIHVSELSEKYPVGSYQVDNLSLYTNRGLGMVGKHIRLFCRPEITIHTLRCV